MHFSIFVSLTILLTLASTSPIALPSLLLQLLKKRQWTPRFEGTQVTNRPGSGGGAIGFDPIARSSHIDVAKSQTAQDEGIEERQTWEGGFEGTQIYPTPIQEPEEAIEQAFAHSLENTIQTRTDIVSKDLEKRQWPIWTRLGAEIEERQTWGGGFEGTQISSSSNPGYNSASSIPFSKGLLAAGIFTVGTLLY